MLVGILGDAHWGVRNDNTVIADYQIRFYKEVFFPELEKRRISTIIQLGDLVDRRKYINYHTLHNMKEHFFNRINGWGWKDNPTYINGVKNPNYAPPMSFIGFPGNHDIAKKESIKINSLEELFNVPGVDIAQNEGQYGIVWLTSPTEFDLEDPYNGHRLKVLCIPWICDENRDDVMRAIERSQARVVFAHLELAGFEMQKGQMMPYGMEHTIFEKFDLVISGHFHSAQRRANILYAGVPYELTWADWNDPKGFWILDTETLEVEFVPNPLTLHNKIFYDETRADFKKWVAGDFDVQGKYVKVAVQNRSNIKTFNKFIDKLEKSGALSVQIIDLPVDLSEAVIKPSDHLVDSSLFDLMKDVVIQSKIANQDPVLQVMRELYDEALEQT